jgi:hypothetical protein
MATLGVIVLILFLLIVLTALISGFIIYLQYRNSPVKRWSRQVLTLLGNARRRLRAERRSYERMEVEKRAEVARLSETAFRKCLARVPVARLQEYPGIGPGTVEKLRDGGFSTLAHLRGASIHIHGLGEKRLSDIRAAIAHLTKETLRQFESGASAEARELSEQTSALDVQYDRLEYVTNSRIKAIEGVIRQVEEVADYARQVTFLRYFRPITETPPVPLEIQETPLPDLDAIVQEAIDEANRVYSRASAKAARQPPAEASPAPADVVAVAVPVGVSKTASTATTKGTSAHLASSPASRPNVARPKLPSQDVRSGAQPVGQFDRGKQPLEAPQPKADEQRHLQIMEATIQFAFLASRLEGPAKAETAALIREHIRQRFAYNPSLYNHGKGFIAHYETGAIDREKCLQSIRDLCTPEHRAILLQLVAQIMGASETPYAKASQTLSEWRKLLGVPSPAKPDANPQPPIKRAVSKDAVQTGPRAADIPASATDAELRSLLDIEPSVLLSAELVRRQYRLQWERLAPEKVQAMGADVMATVAKKRDSARTAAVTLLGRMGQKLAEEVDDVKPKELRVNPDLDNVFGM